MSTLTAAIVNYNSADRIARLIDLLVGSQVTRVSIVDNASAQDDVNVLRALEVRYEWVSVDASDQNLGFGAGVNRAVENLECHPDDLIWILNPDVEPYPSASAQLEQTLRSGFADIVSPLIVQGPRDAPVIYFAGGQINWRLGTTTHVLWGQDPSTAGVGARLTEFMTAAAPMMTASTWQRLKGFREDYFLYWEDADLSVRAARIGLRSAVDPSSVIWHDGLGSASEHGRSPVYYWHMARNRERFLEEWQSHKPGIVGSVARELETAKLALRAIREPEQPTSKLKAVIAGRFGHRP